MPKSYYTLPLRLDEILQKKMHTQCGLRESVAQNLFLLLTTHFRESRFDGEYGCSIWEEDFSLQSSNRWKDEIVKSVTTTIAEYEKRLANVRVRAEMEDHEFTLGEHKRRIKRRLGIWIDGVLNQTNEKFEFYKAFYISPLSF
ncbi:GPW/gp25 family protein [Cytophagaceae bacterium BD1B2-1]|uniref:GPW/gp25 family protein n=2 Tax=Xanthocytophaga agilis TaxID=3048010 RepID=A0AAE3UF85_9BACT|nr:GPW/gp25 family protein [Xanthocytophaga agilis]